MCPPCHRPPVHHVPGTYRPAGGLPVGFPSWADGGGFQSALRNTIARMKRALLSILLLTVAAPLLAAESDCSSLTQLGTLYELRNLAMRHRTSSYDVDSWIDKRIDLLRDPVPGGYRWVRWARPSGKDPVDKHLHKTQAVNGRGTDSVE